MSKTDKSFTRGEAQILRGMVGRPLDFLDAVVVARGDMSWNSVRLHQADFAIDVNVSLGEIPVDELGTAEEFGLLAVVPAPDETLSLPDVSVGTTVVEVGKPILGVTVVNDEVEVFGDGASVATISYPQAIVIDLGDEFLVLDKESWFSETIAVKRGARWEPLVYDDSPNWEKDPEDPGTRYEYRSYSLTL